MTIEEDVLSYVAEAEKWYKPDTGSIMLAFEEQYSPEQVRNALRRLKRQGHIVYVGMRGFGYWRVK